jgi:endonuclease YncB( thermonuclease family)
MFLSMKQSGLGGAPVWAVACFAAGLTAGAWLAPLSAGRSIETAAAAAPAKMVMPATLRGGHPAEVLRVIDGDTFEARVKIWPGMEITTRVRLRGIDAPEMKSRCDDERVKAEASRDALVHLLNEGSVGISGIGQDKYGGRVDADVSTARTPDVSAALAERGLARRYAGGKRESWCG